MKTAQLTRKVFAAFALAEVLAFVTAFPAFATKNTTLELLDHAVRFDVYTLCEEPTYSVSFSWGSMEFYYQYDTGWEYRDPTFNELKFENASLVPVGVTLEFDGQAGYTGKFNTEHTGKGEDYKALYLSARESTDEPDVPTGSMYLILNDKVPFTTQKQRIGEFVVTLKDVVTNGMNQFVETYGEKNIGHVMRSNKIVPFDRDDLNR